MKEMGLLEAIYNQRAIRHLKSDPIPDDILHSLLEAATKAPSGGNRQPWTFIVIRDAAIKKEIGGYYRKAQEMVYGNRSDRQLPQSAGTPGGQIWSDHPEDIPVLIMVCYRTGAGNPPPALGAPPRPVAPRYASVFPAVQNLLLAAVGYGLGAVITTLHSRFEAEVKEILNIPDDVETCCLIPLGYPSEGAHYGPTTRQQVSEVTYYDGWGRKSH